MIAILPLYRVGSPYLTRQMSVVCCVYSEATKCHHLNTTPKFKMLTFLVDVQFATTTTSD